MARNMSERNLYYFVKIMSMNMMLDKRKVKLIRSYLSRSEVIGLSKFVCKIYDRLIQLSIDILLSVMFIVRCLVIEFHKLYILFV